MTPMSAISFLDKQVKPRCFNGKMDEAVESDWMRCLQRRGVEEDSAKAAIQEMVDAGTPMKVSSFYKALRRHSKPVEAENTKPVLLYSIRVIKEKWGYTQGSPIPTRMTWEYDTGFYAASNKAIPTIQTIAYQAAWWAAKLNGAIVWEDDFTPEEYNPF